MNAPSRLRRTNAPTCLVIAALATALTAALPAARGQTLADRAHSLKLAPADAAFYTVSLRLKEQWDIFLASKTYAKLLEIPFVQMAKMQLEFQWQESPEPPIVMVRDYLQSPAGRDALALVREMFSDEIFCYGSADAAGLIELFVELNSFSQSLQFEAAAGTDQEAVTKRVLAWLEEHGEQLKVPDVVFGFRIRDRQRATRHVDILHSTFSQLMQQAPPEIAARLKRERLAGREFLTLRLDGTLLPWDEIRTEARNLSDADFEKIKRLVTSRSLAVAIGVIDEFVVVSLGDSTEHLEKLGQGPLLADNPAFARLAKHAAERVTSINFASKALLSKVNSPRQSMTDLASTAEQLLQMAEVAPEHRAKLVEDIRGLANDLVKYMPEPGDTLAINFLTPRGYEGFGYNTGTRPGADSSQPLAVVNHVAGSPMLFTAARTKETVEDYNLTINWVKRIGQHVEEIVKSQAPPEDWAEYMKYRGRIIELLARLDRANRDKLIPAMRENEQALVVDVASKSVQWFTAMPPSPRPLPMIELGLAARVSDAALLRQGVAEYTAVFNDALRLIREADPDTPDVRLPQPVERNVEGGKLYTFPFPAEWGVDSQIAVNAGLTDTVAAVSLFPAMTEQLLKSKPLAIDTAIDLKRPAAAVTHFQPAKLLGAIRPWIDYGFNIATGQLPAEAGGQINEGQAAASLLQAGMILPQVYSFLDVLSTVRSYTSITYREEDAWVTHAELHIKDLD